MPLCSNRAMPCYELWQHTMHPQWNLINLLSFYVGVITVVHHKAYLRKVVCRIANYQISPRKLHDFLKINDSMHAAKWMFNVCLHHPNIADMRAAAYQILIYLREELNHACAMTTNNTHLAGPWYRNAGSPSGTDVAYARFFGMGFIFQKHTSSATLK